MKWRNEQLYHLRQSQPLTTADQDRYFDEVVSRLFEQEQPAQILFSFLENEACIGYGGLVHINWTDCHAELSFLMDTALEENRFEELWSVYLPLIEQVAFEELRLHKIYTYAFDLRPKLYPILEKAAYGQEARLKEHILFNGSYVDVIIHAKIKTAGRLRKAQTSDLDITYQWLNDPLVRQHSFNTEKVNYSDHQEWFLQKIKEANTVYLIFEQYDGIPLGSIRFDLADNKAKINYLIDPKFQGQGLGRTILQDGIRFLLQEHENVKAVYGWVFKKNIASIKIFDKLDFIKVEEQAELVKFEREITTNEHREL
jgi:RimJ/RimL family protein N-acetyltransferase